MSAQDGGAVNPSTLRDLVRYFLWLGTTGFGGPIALTGYMQRDLVEDRRWISREDYLQGLALAQLAPGPLAAQLAIYLGWVHSGVLGATLAGIAFVLPSFLMVMVLAVLYVRFGGLGWMQGAFYGIGAAVIAIIARSATKLVKMTLVRDPLLWGIFVVNAAVTAWTETEVISVFLFSGVVVLAWRVGKAQWAKGGAAIPALLPPFLLTGARDVATGETLAQLAWFFTKAGAFVFGSGLAIVPFLYGGVVQQQHWLDDRQFLDAVAVAMITPGPVVITVAFIGYLVAGFTGAVVAAAGTFLPCYLLVVIPAGYFRRHASQPHVKSFVDGVTAAATGAIAGAAFVLARRALTDVGAVVICAVTLVVLLKARKAPEPLVVIVAAVVGLLLRDP
ncbi:MAG: chromate transporter [Myxococcota bacterium]